MDTTLLAVLPGAFPPPSAMNVVEQATAFERSQGRRVHLVLPIAVATWEAIDEAMEEDRDHPALDIIFHAVHTEGVTITVIAHDEEIQEGLALLDSVLDEQRLAEHEGYDCLVRAPRVSAVKNALRLVKDEGGKTLAFCARMRDVSERAGVPVYEQGTSVTSDSDLAEAVAQAVLDALEPRLVALEAAAEDLSRKVAHSKGLTVVSPTTGKNRTVILPRGSR